MEKEKDYILDKKLKDSVGNFLIELTTIGTHLHDFRRSPWILYNNFRDAIGYGLTFPSEEQFYAMLSQFKKDRKKDEDSAIDNFISSLSIRQKRGVLTKASLKKGIWRVRDKNYEDLKLVYISYNAATRVKFGDIEIFDLIIDKSYLLEKYKLESEKSYDYMKRYFKMPPSSFSFSTLNNHGVMHFIKYFRAALDYQVKHLFETHPQLETRRWFVDVFDKYSIRFLPAWEQYKRKSTNRPDFKNSWHKFIKFLNGKTYKDLGYSNKTCHHFTKQVTPQGKIWLLYGIYSLLYRRIDREWLQLKEKKAQIQNILKSIPEDQIRDFLDSLKTEYPPDWTYPRLRLLSEPTKVLKDPLF
ncbi:MAG: hypothetical protein NTU69_08165 [Proteobacteria bacterium]|nr:hypothetical protein [Pseudomonadota bacterium]